MRLIQVDRTDCGLIAFTGNEVKIWNDPNASEVAHQWLAAQGAKRVNTGEGEVAGLYAVPSSSEVSR